MKVILLLLFAIFAMPTFAQEIPPSFIFKKELDGATKQSTYRLMSADDVINRHAENSIPIQSLGIIAQPEKNIFAFVFLNANRELGFENQNASEITVSIPNQKISSSAFKLVDKKLVKELKLEFLTFKVTKQEFEKILIADLIKVKFGEVSYTLDKENIVALKAFKLKLDKDLKPAQIVGRRYYSGPKGGCYYLSDTPKKSKVYVEKRFCV